MSKKTEKENKREDQVDNLEEDVIIADQPDNEDEEPSKKEFPANTPAQPGKTVFTTKDIPTGPTYPVELTPEEQEERARNAEKNQ